MFIQNHIHCLFFNFGKYFPKYVITKTLGLHIHQKQSALTVVRERGHPPNAEETCQRRGFNLEKIFSHVPLSSPLLPTFYKREGKLIKKPSRRQLKLEMYFLYNLARIDCDTSTVVCARFNEKQPIPIINIHIFILKILSQTNPIYQ